MSKLFRTLIHPYLNLDLELNSVALNFRPFLGGVGNTEDTAPSNFDSILQDRETQRNLALSRLESFIYNYYRESETLIRSRVGNAEDTSYLNPSAEIFFTPRETDTTTQETVIIPEPDSNTLIEDSLVEEAVVSTDKDDYSPGETATIFGSNFDIGETIQLQVLHTDGTPNTGGGHTPWFITDGGAGDLDGVADGNFRTTWYVNPDDSLNSTFELTAVGQTSEEIATYTFTDSDPAVKFFYIPLDEENLETAFNALEDSTGVDTVGQGIDSIISITVSTDNSIVYYDHWEDGYETDLDNPTQSSTEVWGDNDPSNGIAPGFTTDVLSAGDIIALDNTITVPRDSNATFFDGRDKVGASKAVVVTRQLWFNDPGPVLAGASEILDTSKWGTNFVAPVGEDTSSDSMFEYTSLFIAASENGTNITITGVDTDGDGFYDDTITATLDEGETYFVDGGVGAGATVDSGTKNIQAHLITGDVDASWESRFYTLFPTNDWSNTYYSPVGTVETNNPVDVFIYNPNGSSITVSTSEATEDPTDDSTATSFTVAAGGVARRRLQDSSAVSFSTGANGSDFFAIAAIDANGDAELDNVNANHDWGFSLVPDTNLTPIIQIGWGVGSDDTDDDGVPDQNGSPLWVTTTAATTIYVDYDGDGVGNFTDINGTQYDESFVLGELQSIQLFDTLNNDNDQSGIKVYTVDGTDIIAAWGQDPITADPPSPYLDLGTTVLPLPVSSVWKTSTLIGDDGDGLGDEGETIEYSINIQNDGVVLLGNVNVSEIIPEGTSYVPGSTTVTYIDGKVNSGTTISTSSIADDSTGTAFPLDDDETDNGFDAGLNIGNIDSEESAIVTFQVTINNPYDGTSAFITNSANVDSDEESFTVAVQTELDPTIFTTQTKSLYLSDTNDLDRNDPVGSIDTTSSVSSTLEGNALVGVDFDDDTSGASSPTNWTALNATGGTTNDLIDESNNATPYDLTLAFNGTTDATFSVDISSSQIPSYTNSLDGLDDFAYAFDSDSTASNSIVATWSGLDASTDYYIYVFGLDINDKTQQVTVRGNTTTTFDITSLDNQLYINNGLGSITNSLEDYRIQVTSNSSGQIEIDVDNQTIVNTQDYASLAGLAITPVPTNSNSVTFNQSLSMLSDFTMQSGNQIVVTAYIDVSSGTPDANSGITATLSYDSGTIGSLSSPTTVTSYNDGNGSTDAYEVTWNITLDENVTIPTGEDITLEIASNQIDLDFTVLYDSSTYPSKIDLPTTTVINVDSIEFYNDISTNGGNQINAAAAGDTVYVRVQVSDPFGDSDITGLNLVIDDPDTLGVVDVNLDDTSLVDTSVDASGNGIKIYEYAWSIGSNPDLGSYTITASATEGLESSPITDTDSTTFTVNDGTEPDVFIIDNATATEGNQLVFDVTLTDTSDTDIILDLTTTEGTATEIGDYETTNFEYSIDGGTTWINAGGTNGTQVTIPAGSSGIKVRIDSVSDTSDESDETFILGVSSVVSGTVGSFADTGTGTILDDDAEPNISITDVSITEGDSNTKDLTFTVTLDQTSNQTVTVDYYTSDGTATTADSDYTAIGSLASPLTLTFAPEETSKTITVSVNGDSAVESDETFNVNLTNATNGNITDAQGVGTILNDDSIPDVVIGDASEVEGNQLVFDVGLTSASSEAITLTLDTTSGTATDGTDYENTGFEYSTDNGQNWISATSDQVIIPAGQTSIKVRIDSTDDSASPESEGNETFTLGVASVASGTVGDTSDTGTGTIIDDDGTPTVSINDVTLSEGDSGTTSFTFTVSLDQASSSTVTVDYYTSDGTATTADSDYTALGSLASPLTLTFDPGETSKTITVDVTGDTPVESDETFTVTLASATNASISSTEGTGTGTILNDDDNLGSISGTVFADTDNDDAGESPLSGVTIELLDSSGNAIDSDPNTSGTQPTTTTTDSTGSYSFTDVAPGDYLIKQTNLSGYADVSDNDTLDDDGGSGGTDDDTNSNTNDNLIPVSLSSQESDTGNDFIDEQTGTISGEVLADTNNDDVGDSPLSGVTIQLFEDGNATAIATTTTDSAGTYSFTDVAPGNYTVVETNLSDYGDVSDSDGTSSNDDNTIAVTLSAGGTSTGNDFVDERGVIRGTVQADTDDNNTGDIPLENVTITLKDDSGNTVATTTTASDGTYIFTDLPSGTYTVEETNLTGYTDVSEDEGGSDDDVGDNSITNSIGVILTVGEEDLGNDFVDEALPETIAGKVLEDTDGDGVGDSPLAGVEITLSDTDAGTADLTVTTGSDGSYSFDVSATGADTYTLTSPESNTGTVAGYNHLNELDSITDDNTNDTDLEDNSTNNDRTLTVALVAGEADTGNDFVYEAIPGTISGTVFADDGDGNGNVGKDGVVLTLLDGDGNPVLDDTGNAITVTTSGGGTYSFTDLEPGDYQIQETDPTGYSSVSDSDGTDDDGGASGSDNTDDDTNSDTNDNIIAVTLGAGETDTGNNFFDQLNGTISGQVLEDTDGDTNGNVGIGGVTVTLKDSSGNTVAIDITDSNGDYSFSDVTPGDYTVEQTDLTGYSSITDEDSVTDSGGNDGETGSDGSNDNTISVSLSAGETDSGNDFVDAQNASISGSVTADTDGDDAGDTNLSGVTITLRNASDDSTVATTTTDSSGNYSFTDIAPGDYEVVETNPDGYADVNELDSIDDDGGASGGSDADNELATADNDNILSVSLISGESDTGNDFVDEQTGTISGIVTDNNSNTLSGVTISLFDTDTSTTVTTTTTASNGTYSFTDVTPGNYEVRATTPTNYSHVSDADNNDDGSDDSDNEDSSTSNDEVLTVALADGELDTRNDFVYQVNGTGFISGTVLEDTDGDGIGDTPLIGVNITLDDGVNTPTTIQTDSNGNYTFSSLDNGTYTITQENLNGYGDVAESDSTNDNSISVTLSGTSTGNNFVDGLEASISGVVWEDLDENGIRGQFEDVVTGVNVTLTGGGADGLLSTTGDNTIDTLTTAADGTYSFTGLNPGEEYQVSFPTTSSGNSLTSQDQGSNDTIDSDANTSTGVATNNGTTDPITLTPGENRANIDAGYVSGSSVIDGTDSSEDINGTSASETIIGYKGQDTLSGGGGSDTFFFNETSDGIDIIEDFTSGTDKLDFRGIVDEIEAYISPSTVTDAIAEGYITQEFFSGVGTMVRVDFDASGSLNPKDVVFLQNLTGTIPDTDFILA